MNLCCTERVHVHECAHTVRREGPFPWIFPVRTQNSETNTLGRKVRVCRGRRTSRSRAQAEAQEKCASCFPCAR